MRALLILTDIPLILWRIQEILKAIKVQAFISTWKVLVYSIVLEGLHNT